jgi:hypothetical protein
MRLEPKTPIILVPGLTGSKLRDPKTGEIVWGTTARLLSPHDGGASLALSLDPNLRKEADLIAFDVIHRMNLGLKKLDIYGGLIDLLEAAGYRLGSLDDPHPDDTLFVVPYDWRRNNVSIAANLVVQLERLRVVRNESELRVHAICHSNSARIVRYAMKYGGAPLEEAWAGRARPLENVRVEKLMLIGTANGGSTNGFRNMHQGRDYAPLIGRTFKPEAIFTFESAFEALPAYRTDLFFGEAGEALDIDLFDPDNWERYGWSIYAQQATRRIRKKGREELYGTPEQRRAHLAQNLERSRKLHLLLMRDVPNFPETRYYMVQNDARPTPDRVLLTRDKSGEWRTTFFPERKVRKPPYVSLASTPGDGHAAVLSQEWLSPQEIEAFAVKPLYVPAYHRTLIRHPVTQKALLGYLLD